MPVNLRVLAGPSPCSLVDISDKVNTDQVHNISSDGFEGLLSLQINRFPLHHRTASSDYFERPDRRGITWSIQVQGRFLQPQTADDVLFGNIFERPLTLPWGSSAAFQFMKYIDPTLEHDLTSQTKPWALSPLISTMPHFAHRELGESDTLPEFPPRESLKDDNSQLAEAVGNPIEREKLSPQLITLKTADQRRAYFASKEARQSISFGPNDLITTDFCYGFLEFSPELALRIPGGISFNLTKYWDGQPVQFVCCKRRKLPDDEDSGNQEGVPWEEFFWCVSIQLGEQVEDPKCPELDVRQPPADSLDID
ncbi:hypothetical protein BJ322DRAFT_1018585 [Thelephora terrestris]|uniref:Domain of unknown function at the cortex 1 domain-containing protein n=1 Tax=Thelephora terrestris TaxID=56493 RepID=A0A9P6HJ17_9AGAM|nr:hypothetical protein BJ322DRAFT_1018585 [Thelephora terrestris]